MANFESEQPQEKCRNFEDLYLENKPILYGYFLKKFRDPFLAEDLTQDTFLNAFMSPKWATTDHLIPWLLRIAINEGKEHLRHVASRPREFDLSRIKKLTGEEITLDSLTIDPDPTPEEALLLEERSSRLRACVDALLPNQRIATTLEYYSDRTQKEIAAITGKPIDAVKNTAFRSRASLRKIVPPDLAA